MKTITDSTVRQIWRNLREFGYSSLDLPPVQEAVQRLQRGEDPGADIIAVLARSMLIENGYLEDSRS